MAATAAQLRFAEGSLSAQGRSLYAADLGAGQSQSGGRVGRLDPPDAEEPGPDECALASCGSGGGWGNGDGDFTGDCERRARSRETGGVAGLALSEQPGRDGRTVARTLARGSSVQSEASADNVRCRARTPGGL